VKKFAVSFRPAAEKDLLELYEYIAEAAGLGVAANYMDRIEAACLALETFPLRGRARDDIRPGLRMIGFERRATIVYRVIKSEVVIVRTFHGGRDFERILRESTNE